MEDMQYAGNEKTQISHMHTAVIISWPFKFNLLIIIQHYYLSLNLENQCILIAGWLKLSWLLNKENIEGVISLHYSLISQKAS